MGSLSKFRDGETQKDYFQRIKAARKHGVKTVKTELRVRDGVGCRWPGCDFWKAGYAVHGVHLEDAGMGGDPKLIRTQRAKMIRLCVRHHGPGPITIHSKHREVVPLTDRGTDGPCLFRTRKTLDDPWVIDGVEDEYEISRRFNPAAEESEDDE